jgi:SWI/SNF-related matrix-associated actin-dependent regulator 1 of chromatin subfamily A
MTLRTTLYDFQAEDVRRIRDFGGRALVSHEPGCGKTVISLAFHDRYLPDDPPGPTVVVVPAHLKLNWRREVEKHLGERVEILHGQTCPDGKFPPADPNQIFVINYDILVPPHWKARTQPPPDSWAYYLGSLNPRLLIGDEGHRLSGKSTARTRAFRYLARRTPHVLILTGTPLANKPADLWPLLNILYPKEYQSQHEFLSEHTYMVKHWWGWQSVGAKSLDLLHRKLTDTCMIRRRKIDVMSQLPAVTYSVIPIECDLKEYNKAAEDYIGWLEEQSPLMAARAARAAELARLNGLRQLAGQAKVEAVVDRVEAFLEESGGKMLLGAVHYKVTEPLCELLGKKATLVDGRMSPKEKQLAFDTFNRSPDCRVLVGNIDAAGTGWSCQATSDVGLVEIPWRPSDIEQFAGRSHGINRGVEGVNTHLRFYIAAGTLEESLCEALQRKANWSAAAIDGDPDAADLDILSQVRTSILKGRKPKK